MSYTREQRMAKAVQKANEMAAAATAAGLNQATEPAPQEVEPQVTQPKQEKSEDRPKREIPRGNQTRAAAMEEIVKRGSPEPEPEPEAKVEAQPEKPEVEVKAETPVEAPKVKQKVDGQEYEVTQAELDEAGGERAWRIQKASENRLARANEALAEANKVKAEMAEFAKRQAPPAPVQSNQDFIKEKMDVIRFGTPEESAQAMMEVMSRNNTDPNKIVMQATANFKHESAFAKFRTDFQDVVTNPVLSRLVPQMMQEALSPYVKNGTPDWSGLSQLDWYAEFAKIGNQIRGAVPRQSQSQPTAAAPGNPSQDKPDKEARKASIVNLPTAGARAALPEEEKPESREQILESMRKARKIST